MTKLRFEFPKTNNIDDNGIINLARMTGKCLSVRRIEEVIVDLENISDKAYMHLPKNCHKNIYLEEVGVVRHIPAKSSTHGSGGFVPPKKNIHDNKRMRKASLSFGISSGWFSENQEVQPQSILEFNDTMILKNLEYFSARLSGVFSISEGLNMFDVMIPRLTKLISFSIEFSNCKISDFEIITLSQVLFKAQQIKHFRLKVLQYPNVSKDCIYFLVKTLLKFSNIKKFDLYFRRLSLDDREITELIEGISELKVENLNCSCFKKDSLHIYFNLADEKLIQSREL